MPAPSRITRLLAGAALSAMLALPAAAQTLRVVLVNDLASLDPVQSTAAVVRNHGFMVYDQLFALDSKGEPQPQMVESFDRSPDGMRWRFTLREGLAQLRPTNDQGELYLTDVVALAREAGRTVSAYATQDAWQTEGVNDRVQLARMNAEVNRRTLDGWMRAGVTVVDPTTSPF